MSGRDRRVVAGFKLPEDDPIVGNEPARLDIPRSNVGAADPRPLVTDILALRVAVSPRHR